VVDYALAAFYDITNQGTV